MTNWSGFSVPHSIVKSGSVSIVALISGAAGSEAPESLLLQPRQQKDMRNRIESSRILTLPKVRNQRKSYIIATKYATNEQVDVKQLTELFTM